MGVAGGTLAVASATEQLRSACLVPHPHRLSPFQPTHQAEYVHACAHDAEEVPEVRDLATKTWHAMKRTAKAGQRRTLPDMQVRLGKGWCGCRVGWWLASKNAPAEEPAEGPAAAAAVVDSEIGRLPSECAPIPSIS